MIQKHRTFYFDRPSIVLSAQRIICGGMIFFAGLAQAEPQDRDGVDAVPIRPSWTLKSVRQAAVRAEELLDLVEPKGESDRRATLTALSEDNTPYLHERLVGRPIWHVVVPNWSVRLDSLGRQIKDHHTRTVDVYLDPVDGKLLKLRTRWPKDEIPIASEPSSQSAEEQFRRASDERYLGFPNKAPTISLLDALDSMYRSGVDVFAAKQIVAQCVVRSTRYKKPHTVWAITLRGVLPYRTLPGWPTDAQYEYRYIVNADTGVYESVTNIPHPAAFLRERSSSSLLGKK